MAEAKKPANAQAKSQAKTHFGYRRHPDQDRGGADPAEHPVVVVGGERQFRRGAGPDPRQPYRNLHAGCADCRARGPALLSDRRHLDVLREAIALARQRMIDAGQQQQQQQQ